jgi:general secretion pathway protein A
MFHDYYKMKEQPFGVTPDPRFLYLGASHREALASLHYGIESDRGFMALIAYPGLGKTTLTFQLLEKLQQDSRTVFLFQTQCNLKEFFHYLLDGLGAETDGMDIVSMHNKLNQILSRELLAGRRFVLAIDEAQNLEPEVLEAIRLLSNFETSRTKMLQILLIGQPQLARKLATPALEQLQQRISVFAKIEPFDAQEIALYITHRLKVAGYEGKSLFSPDALQIIAEQSQGIPRKINALCFSALSISCAMGRDQVDSAIMQEVIADRDLGSLQRPIAATCATSVPTKPSPAISSPTVPSPKITFPAAARPTLSLPATHVLFQSVDPPKGNRRFGSWAMGAAGIAALVAIVIGSISLTPRIIDHASQVSSTAWASVRRFLTVQFQAAELSGGESVQPSTSNDDSENLTVIVQSGETLRQILLRRVGEYDETTIGQIQKLNPKITDINHITVGQALRLPHESGTVDSVTARDKTGVARKK